METKHLPNTGGVYLIVNTVSGKVYIGSSASVRRRLNAHRRDLEAGKHGNQVLQRAWDKHGSAAMAVTLLEAVQDDDQLFTREQHWLDTYKTQGAKVYNILPTAGSPRGWKRGRAPQAALERHSWTLATPAEGFITPDGHEVTILNLGLFCREHGLTTNTMRALQHGRATTHKGWTHRNAKAKNREWIKTHSGFINPNGEEVPPFANMQEFCRLNGLSVAGMRDIRSGKRPSHKGWTHRDSPEKIPHTQPKKAATYTGFISPTGERVTITNLSQFCRDHGLDHATLYRVIQGKASHHKGWRYDRDTGEIQQISLKQRPPR